MWWTELRISDSYYYLMHDNTADGSVMNPSAPYYWWEASGSGAQFNAASVKRK